MKADKIKDEANQWDIILIKCHQNEIFEKLFI